METFRLTRDQPAQVYTACESLAGPCQFAMDKSVDPDLTSATMDPQIATTLGL
jgi:hypothetical protein